MSNYIISYEQGYYNWYVSEFYKYFHKKLEDKLNTHLEYEPISIFAKRFNYELDNHSDSLFNWFNLIIYNKDTEKFFVHSWYDYANATVEWCVRNQLNIVKFSAVSNIDQTLIDKYSFVQPSVYCLENWSDHDKIKEIKITNQDKIKKIYFAGLDHGIRQNILNRLKNYDIFNIFTKSQKVKPKEEYYNELSKHLYGLSLNGAANICYRDIEIFGLGVLNLRDSLYSKTFNPLESNVHYINFIDNQFIQNILQNYDIDEQIKEKTQLLEDILTSQKYQEIIENAYTWYATNCLPDSQFNIISSFLSDLTILD
jgi:hypothetical protein